MVPRHAMVFAAGRGERMGPLTRNCAKPALPLAGVPVLTRILDHLHISGVREVVVNLHHAPASLEPLLRAAAGKGLRVHRSEEPELLGTSGGLERAVARFGALGFGRSPFLVLNADAYSEFDVAAFASAHRDRGGHATLLADARPGPEFERERRLEVDAGGRLVGLLPAGSAGPVFCGTWLLEPAALELLEPGTLSLAADLLPGLIRTGAGFVVPTRARWYEIGAPARYLAASLAFPSGPSASPTCARRIRFAPDAIVDYPALVGEGCVVESGAVVSRSVLLDGVEVGAGAVVRDSVVAAGERIPAGARLSGVLRAAGVGRPL